MYKINRYWHKCNLCGSKNGEYYILENGPHYGLYCSNCDKWVKWIKKTDMLHLTGNKNINKIYNKEGKETDAYEALNLSKPIPLKDCVDVDTLSKEELEKLDLPF